MGERSQFPWVRFLKHRSNCELSHWTKTHLAVFEKSTDPVTQPVSWKAVTLPVLVQQRDVFPFHRKPSLRFSGEDLAGVPPPRPVTPLTLFDHFEVTLGQNTAALPPVSLGKRT